MKFLLDENFPKAAQQLLRTHGSQVYDIRGTPHEGADDESVFSIAQERGAVLLTTDRDFFHTVPHVFPQHHGVVVIALRQPNRQNLLARLEWFLRHFGSEDIHDKVFELRDRTYVTYSSRMASGQRDDETG